jgi:hypothetical protein
MSPGFPRIFWEETEALGRLEWWLNAGAGF